MFTILQRAIARAHSFLVNHLVKEPWYMAGHYEIVTIRLRRLDPLYKTNWVEDFLDIQYLSAACLSWSSWHVFSAYILGEYFLRSKFCGEQMWLKNVLPRFDFVSETSNCVARVLWQLYETCYASSVFNLWINLLVL